MLNKNNVPGGVVDQKPSAEALNIAMGRFPLIVEILGNLRDADVPSPGDSDLLHGCQRALTAMLVELARIDPAPPGRSLKVSNNIRNMLHDNNVEQLIDPDQLQRFHHCIERILGPSLPPR